MKRNILNKLYTALLAFGCVATFEGYALDANFFASESRLSSGKWVKIGVAESGIYEISYDELRSMGFSHPEKVILYGRGGKLLPENFTNSTGVPLYKDNLTPVAMLRHNGKVYFYGQGTESIRYCSENHDKQKGLRFERKSVNTYAPEGYYFLTESEEDQNIISYSDKTVNSSLPTYSIGWDYFYHEKDLVNPALSGMEFFGESFVDADKRRLELPYMIENAVPGTEASLACQFVDASSSVSNLTYGLTSDSGVTSEPCKATLRVKNLQAEATDQYVYAEPAYGTLTLPSDQGTMYVEYDPGKLPLEMANLDYLLLGAKKHLIYPADASAMRAYTYDYNSTDFGHLSIPGLPEGAMVWDITDSNNITSLPYTYDKNTGAALVSGLADSKTEGLLIAFDPSRQQLKVSSQTEVANSNIHNLGAAGNIPSMVIITLPEFQYAAEEIARLHKEYQGIDVAVVLSDDVINEFSDGTPDPMAYRALCKMLYDRDDAANRTFKNVLLFGPMTYDARGVEKGKTREYLVSPQSEVGNKIDATFCLTDVYGTLDDYYPTSRSGALFYFRPMDIGVGLLPVETTGECDVMVEKIQRYLTDDSFAYWCTDIQYVADGSDRFEHQKHCKNLSNGLKEITEDEHACRKVYANAYRLNEQPTLFALNLDDGQLFSTYVGHASARSMSSEFWSNKDLAKLKNDRLSFMFFAGCSISPFDQNDRGTGEKLIYYKDHGLIGGIMTNRTAYSFSNYELMSWFQRVMHLETPGIVESERIKEPLTFGEIYAKGKTLYTKNSNKLAYHLIADPALVPPVPTTVVKVDAGDGSARPAVHPLSKMSLSGIITDRAGKHLKDFNGTAVAKVYAPAYTKIMNSRFDTSVKPDTVVFDETVLSVVSFDVRNGEFKGSVFVPGTLAPTDQVPARIRFTAYDPVTRLASSGKLDFDVLPFDESKAVADENAPRLEAMYINTPDFREGDIVAPSFNMHVEMSDDNGFEWNGSTGLASIYMTLDDKFTLGGVGGYLTFADGGNRCEINYPFRDIAPGLHTVSVKASDHSGNSLVHKVAFMVSDPVMTPVLTLDEGPVRESKLMRVSVEGGAKSKKICVLDHKNNIVFEDSFDGDTYEWNACNAAGQRVAPGVYYAVCRTENGNVVKGVSAPVRMTVLKN